MVILTKTQFPNIPSSHLERLIQTSLNAHKASDIVCVDLGGKADFADSMVIASGTSARHVSALAHHVADMLKSLGFARVSIEGLETCDWVLVDAGDVVVHLFRPEVRRYYNLEKMWSVALPAELEAAH